MIFVTVGTHHDPFPRLIDGLAALPADRLVVQHGHAEPPMGVRRAVPFLDFAEMLVCFREAEAVITHAGVGSILCATNAGHIPIVVPRLQRHGEHVDDHQVELVRELDKDGKIIVAWEVEDLADALRRVPARGRSVTREAGPLHAAVRAALGVDAGRPAPSAATTSSRNEEHHVRDLRDREPRRLQRSSI